ncbi:MAG: hypothetical protein EXR95_03395 [Gemmatimonadetes bacterium]|nr:hypothetical protein [Gemmatimonadota bacterium]
MTTQKPFRSWPYIPLLAAALLGCAGAGTEAGAQDVTRCEPVRAFLTEQFGMVAEISPDTIDDWRTAKIVPGCRVTAAGGTPIGLGQQAGMLYNQLGVAGWTRTPEPRDAPAESALRMRLSDTDCFFTPYSGIAIGTEAERRVTMAFEPRSDDARYNLLVQCMPAMDAIP